MGKKRKSGVSGPEGQSSPVKVKEDKKAKKAKKIKKEVREEEDDNEQHSGKKDNLGIGLIIKLKKLFSLISDMELNVSPSSGGATHPASAALHADDEQDLPPAHILHKLMDRIEAILPKDDTVKYDSR